MINRTETKMYYQHKLFSLGKNWGIQHLTENEFYVTYIFQTVVIYDGS